MSDGEAYKIWANFYKMNCFKHDLYIWKVPIIKIVLLVKKSTQNQGRFFTEIFQKSDVESQFVIF